MEYILIIIIPLLIVHTLFQFPNRKDENENVDFRINLLKMEALYQELYKEIRFTNLYLGSKGVVAWLSK